MSGVFVLAPVLAAAPVVLTATTAVAAAMGFVALSQGLQEVEAELNGLLQQNSQQMAEFDVAEAKGLTRLIAEQGPIVLDRPDATVCFRSGKGRVQMLVRGKGSQTREQLEELGQEVLQRIQQQYAYHSVMTDLKKRGFGKVEEVQEEDGTIRLRLRRWD